jgi:hypothetical protein
MSKTNPQRYSKKRQKQKSWLPLLLALGGLALVGLAFFALRDRPASGAAIQVTGSPSLKGNQEMIDLGDMKFNQLADVSFQLTNVGDRTLRFSKEPFIDVVEGC